MLRDHRHEISRLEAFSDAAFAFVLTLLIVSLDVPRSCGDLIRIMVGFPSFDIKMYADHHLVSAGIGAIAVLVAIAAPVHFSFLSPFCFALMGPAHWWCGTRFGRRRQVLEQQLAGFGSAGS